MPLPIEVDTTSPNTLQAQVVARIRELILTNRLTRGTQLPASRELSAQLGISRNTVNLAYERLIAEGYLETRPTIGTFVNASIPEESLILRSFEKRANNGHLPRPATRVAPQRFRAPLLYERPKERTELDFRVGRPDARSFPLQTWRRLVDEHLATAGHRMTEYGNPAGLYDLRKAIADHIGPARGINATPEQVVIVGGCEEALNVVAKILVPREATVCVESPCYQGVAFVFESFGGRMMPIPVDDEGLDVDRLPEGPVNLVCVTPSHQFPIGVTMSLSRRLRLLDWANRVGAYIVEDDYDSDFRYDGSPLTALAGLDRDGCVIYVGTFSKSIGAALRIGYLVVPPELIGPAREAKALLDSGNPWLDQAVLAEFLSSGRFANHLRRIRQTYLLRRDCIMECLRRYFGDVQVLGHEGGMHLTWMLPENWPSARSVQYAALDVGVGVYTMDDGPAFDWGRYPLRDRALLLGYPCLTEKQIGQAMRRVAAILPRLSSERPNATSEARAAVDATGRA